MTVIQLECFMELIKQRNFSKAAANLFLSQPTFSRHIQSLEEELRAKLIIRSNNVIHLTPIGEALYPSLEQLHRQFREASITMHEIVDRHTGLFRIGVAASLRLQEEYRQAIQDVKRQHSNARIQLSHLNLSEMYDALMSGSVDVLLAMEAFVPPSDKVCKSVLYSERMYLAVPASHPNSDLTSVAHDEINDYFPDLELCLVDASAFDPSLQERLKSIMDDYDDSEDLVRVPASNSDMQDIQLMVEAGLGVTCINESSTLRDNPDVRLIPLVDVMPDSLVYRQAVISVYWIDRNYNPILKTFLNSLKRQYE